METRLKTIFWVLVGLTVVIGFLPIHHHFFPWDDVPSVDAVFGIIGTFLLLIIIKFIGSFARKKEDFYD